MRRILLLFIYFLFIITVGRAQVTFVKSLGGIGDDIARSAIETRDGNYLVIGSTTSYGSGGSDGYIAKLNGSAKEIWDRTVGGSGDDVFQNGIQLNNGDFILVGWTSSFGSGSQDVLITKLDRFGNIDWTKTYGGSNDDLGFSVLETSDGNILVAGHTSSFGSGALDVFIIKLDPNGSQIWSKSYGTSENDWFNGQGIIEDSFGNYVLSGAWRNSGSNPHDGFLMKLDASGDLLFLEGYGGSFDDSMTGSLRETSSGYQNIGNSWSWNGSHHVIWMSDLTQEGMVNWSKTFGWAGKYIAIASSQYTDDGNYLISAYEFSEHSAAKGEALLLKVTPNGEIVWAKSFGDAGLETLDVVFETYNGVIAFGKTTSFGEGGNDILVVRTDHFGTVSGCSDNVNITTTDVNPLLVNPSFLMEELNLGENQTLDVSNIDFIENLVCDGCSADDLTAGLLCENAPIICSIDCLDGFTATLPTDYILPQPDPLCGGNGFPNNVSWFAFVAGSNTVDLTIIPTNCTTIYNDDGNAQTIGIQAGIYEDCSFLNSIVCQTDGCNDLVAESLNLASDQFLEGQTYYLFVDGCGGSICDYEVVVNSAQQAFEMDEITTISNDLNLDLDQDTLCQGTEITLILDNFEQSVDFNWSIDPPTAEFPSGLHSVTDTSAVTFQFDEVGCFDIHVYAYNDCDNSETRTISVCIKALEDEIFSDIYVCQECFPITLISPESGCIITEGGGAPTVLIEDPNGDGVPGWIGTSLINGPGLDSNIVVNNFGCTYKQFVNVIEIPISPREQIDYYYCIEEFPVDINGTIFNDPGDTKNITLHGGAVSGCDSLQSITARAIEFSVESNIGNCEEGKVELTAVVNNLSLVEFDDVEYTWYDENWEEVSDSDGIDSILTVMDVGSYSVKVQVTVNGKSCSQTFDSFAIDVDDLAPSIPNVTYAPIDICVSELEAIIYVANQNLDENYIWTFTPNMPFSFGLTSDTVYVDISNGQDFEFCVYAMNGCGSTSDFCDNVNVVEAPDSDFTMDTEICVDSLVTVEYIGTAAIDIFNWDFDGGVIRNGMNPNSSGPFEIEFPASGQYEVSLIVSESGCNSIETSYAIEVFEAFDPPMIDCVSGAGSVTLSWDDTDVDDVDVLILTGQTSFDLLDNSIIVNELNSEEVVNIQFTFNQGEICGPTIVTENCISQPCPEVELILSLSDQDVCFDSGLDIALSAFIVGDDTGAGNWEGDFINNDNEFDVLQAGIGEHIVSYSYELGDCFYKRDTIIAIHDSPQIDTVISLSFCEEMGSNLVDIITSGENTVMLDEVELSTLEGVEVEVGDHTISVSNPEGCSSTLDFTIESMGVEEVLINGNSTIIKGETEEYEALVTSDLEDLNLIWTLDEDTICVNCERVDVSLEGSAELCVSIEFGDGCLIKDCLTIEVSERIKIFIPNAFSPNNDNVNDHFVINSNNRSVFVEEVMIFDRWGEMVYNKRGFNLSEETYSWDGLMNGQLCAEGVYVYIVTYMDEENRRKRISGDLTLVR